MTRTARAPSPRLLRLLPLGLCCAFAASMACADAIEYELAFRAAQEAGDHARAAAAGDAWLAALTGGAAPDDPDLAEPLTEIARAQRLAGDHETAELNLRNALSLLPDVPLPHDHRRLDTLTELGLLYQDAAEHDVAVVAFDEARRLSRQQLGLLNERQSELLELSGQSYLMTGQDERASEVAAESLLLSERRLGNESPALLAALQHHARWQHQLQDFEGEQRTLQRAVDIIRRDGGSHDPRLIEPLLATAASLRAERSFREDDLLLERGGPRRRTYQTAVRQLSRALEVVRANADIDPQLHARILLEQGDWYLVRDRQRQALDSYRAAIGLLEAGGRQDLVDAWFSTPVVLMQPEPLHFGMRPLEPAPGLQPARLPVASYSTDRVHSETGFVTARFEVDERGRARHVRVIESQPPRRMHARVHESLRDAVFRPRIVDGEPLASPDQQYTFRYAYRP